MDINYFKQIQRDFATELTLASENKQTSLAFIRNTIPTDHTVPEGTFFQAIVIGGSMYHSALVKKNGKKIEIVSINVDKLPIFSTQEDFFSFLEHKIHTNIDFLALNFAYPLSPIFDNGKLDGILVGSSKGHTFKGLLNKKVGYEIEQYLLKKRNQKAIVSIANDTICLVMSGLTNVEPENLASGIVGTGLNFAMFLDKKTVINIEAGGFNRFKQTNSGKVVDSLSNNKGEQLYEKEVSGAYLYQHVNYVISKEKLSVPFLKESLEISNFAMDNTHILSSLAKEHLERSAAFLAAQMAGITLFKKIPLTFVMQGGLFWNGFQYKETVEKYVKKLLPDIPITIVAIDHCDIIGAAKLLA